MKPTYETLWKIIEKQDEPVFTKNIVIPLLQKIRPGKVEYTHSATEAGRDIVSYSLDVLGRYNLLCVQVKTNKISFGAKSIGELASVAQTAKDSGVTLENGTRVIPDDVWVLSTSPFPENERRQVEDIITKLNRNHIKIIAFDEFANLIISKAPELVEANLNYLNSDSLAVIKELQKHSESRAFGLAYDKNISSFFVPISIAPHFIYANIALNSNFDLTDDEFIMSVPLFNLISEKELSLSIKKIEKIYCEKVFQKYYEIIETKDSKLKKIPFVQEIPANVDVTFFLEELENVKIKLSAQGKFSEEILEEISHLVIRCPITLNLNDFFYQLLSKTRTSLKKCPSTIIGSIKNVIALFEFLNKLNTITKYLVEQRLIHFEDVIRVAESIVTIKIPDPMKILGLSNIVLVEGPPGCGKTTLLKMIALKGIDSGKNVLFVPSSSITLEKNTSSLCNIVAQHSLGNNKKTIDASTILVLDALDEAPFDLSEKIFAEKDRFERIIISTRTAHQVEIKAHAFCIALSPFDAGGRNEFFKKWFKNDKAILETIKEMFIKYPDIDRHSRLPLIATIMATLVENKLEPTSKIDIYDFRLELLLSEWDRKRDVKRSRFSNNKAKRRFLQFLAYRVHSLPGRMRTFDVQQLRRVYEESLGAVGYVNYFEDLLHDLVVNSGILIDEYQGKYSFGHLSFQEHLAGEYIYENIFSFSQIKRLMLNDWWYEPLIFYAAKKGDISELIKSLFESEEIFRSINILNRMIEYAHFTSPGAKQIVADMSKQSLEEQVL